MSITTTRHMIGVALLAILLTGPLLTTEARAASKPPATPRPMATRTPAPTQTARVVIVVASPTPSPSPTPDPTPTRDYECTDVVHGAQDRGHGAVRLEQRECDGEPGRQR